MSASYYLHCTDFPESVHIGASAGDRWTTDTSTTATYPGSPGWVTTGDLIAYLDALSVSEAGYAPWVADEYGRVHPPAEAAEIIRSHAEHREFDRAFS